MISPHAAIADMTRTGGAELSRTPVGDATAGTATPVTSLSRHRRPATFKGPPRLSAGTDRNPGNLKSPVNAEDCVVLKSGPPSVGITCLSLLSLPRSRRPTVLIGNRHTRHSGHSTSPTTTMRSRWVPFLQGDNHAKQ